MTQPGIPSRVESGQVRRCLTAHGSGRVRPESFQILWVVPGFPGQVRPARSEPAREEPSIPNCVLQRDLIVHEAPSPCPFFIF